MTPGRLVPDLFADIIDARFGLLTYRNKASSAPGLPAAAFTTASCTATTAASTATTSPTLPWS